MTPIPDDIWAGWIETACRLNEYAAPERPAWAASAPTGRRDTGGPDAPGTDFNRRGSWQETGLFDAGWSWARRAGGAEDRGLVCRPGKEGGVSGSVGMITSQKNGWPLFYCWSTSVAEFVPEEPYSRFAVYAILNHAGDYSAAAKALAARGYGSPMPDPPTVTFGAGDGPAGPSETTDPARLFKWMSELRHREANDKWLWHGLLSRGGVTLLSALWKAGKSTLLTHLARAFDGRHADFLGLEIVPARVLYVTEEHEELWAERRDELGIGDHVGMVCRPFKGRPSPAEWAAFIGELVKAVSDHRFDLVVLDTISKLWPVREENDAGQVEDALMPLWNVTNMGAALLLVHHNRKSDGKEFTGMRGSGGLPAFCETLVEFRRNSEDSRDNKRVLTNGGRYRETPHKLLIELTPSGYVSHGDPDDPGVRVVFGEQAWKGEVDGLVPDAPPGRTVDEIHAELDKVPGCKGARNQDLIALLNARFEGGEYERIGKGTKGSAFRYYRVTAKGSTPCNGGEEPNEEPNPDESSDGD